MNISLVVIVGLIIVTTILALATAAIAASYSQLYSEFERVRKKFVSGKKDIKAEEEIMAEEKLLLKQKLEQVVVTQTRDFQNVLNDLEKQSLKLISDVNEAAKLDVKSSLEEFRKLLVARANQDAERTKADLDKYLKEKELEIDKKAVSILQEVARKVLPEAINMEAKKDLIIRALEKAKQDKMFWS